MKWNLLIFIYSLEHLKMLYDISYKIIILRVKYFKWNINPGVDISYEMFFTLGYVFHMKYLVYPGVDISYEIFTPG